MKALIERTNQVLALPLKPGPRTLLVVAALLMVAAWFLPLWKIAAISPEAVRSGAESYELVDASMSVDGFDPSAEVAGPRDLPGDLDAFRWVPFALGALALLFLRAAVLGTTGTLVDVSVLFVYFAAFAVWSFETRFSRYGQSFPGPGAYVLGAVVVVLAAALALAWRQGRSEMAGQARMIG